MSGGVKLPQQFRTRYYIGARSCFDCSASNTTLLAHCNSALVGTTKLHRAAEEELCTVFKQSLCTRDFIDFMFVNAFSYFPAAIIVPKRTKTIYVTTRGRLQFDDKTVLGFFRKLFFYRESDALSNFNTTSIKCHTV